MKSEVYETSPGVWAWRFLHGGKEVAHSAETYQSEGEASSALSSFRGAPSAADRGERLSATGGRSRSSWLATFVLLVPFLGAVLSFVGGYAGVRFAAVTDIKTHAVDLVFAGNPTPADVQSRIVSLTGLFPEELKDWQGDAINSNYLFPSANSGRWAFLQLMMQKLQCPEQIVSLWDKLFGPNRVEKGTDGDNWITSIAVVPCPTTPAAAQTAAPATPTP